MGFAGVDPEYFKWFPEIAKNVSKPAFVISQVLLLVQEINYPSRFIVD